MCALMPPPCLATGALSKSASAWGQLLLLALGRWCHRWLVVLTLHAFLPALLPAFFLPSLFPAPTSTSSSSTARSRAPLCRPTCPRGARVPAGRWFGMVGRPCKPVLAPAAGWQAAVRHACPCSAPQHLARGFLRVLHSSSPCPTGGSAQVAVDAGLHGWPAGRRQGCGLLPRLPARGGRRCGAAGAAATVGAALWPCGGSGVVRRAPSPQHCAAHLVPLLTTARPLP